MITRQSTEFGDARNLESTSRLFSVKLTS